ncbi:transcriptional regulator TbsP domain-containing protein [Halorubrum kocurii]|uniref:Uncharacterized protein n=1 Tax=Halorubrum kocurii JCM 14978 TaxID=1230456 RepID=M0NIM2_9EURY|nr:DUF5821 family protein [Halorubrum kocurii]EMA56944.1 hypothetical protein C468_17349 [Halorubrum kocurii JCM 14978]
MASPSPPTLPLADGPTALGSFTDPIAVDPDPRLLAALAAAYREAALEAVDPGLDALRAAARAEGDPLSPVADLPTLTVLASDRAVDALTDRFRPAGRLAALVEAGAWDLRTLAEPQPNAVLAGRSDGCVLVGAAGERDGDRGHEAERDGDGAHGTWCRIGADTTLRERYDGLLAEGEAVRLRTPSRHRLYGALSERCGDAVADEAVRLLDVNRDAGGDPLDRGGARVRTYAAGARRGALDRDLRRACEDAGIGSSATFTRIKRDLTDAGLVETEPVSQPVGRPRQRLVPRGALADGSSPSEAVAALRKTGI